MATIGDVDRRFVGIAAALAGVAVLLALLFARGTDGPSPVPGTGPVAEPVRAAAASPVAARTVASHATTVRIVGPDGEPVPGANVELVDAVGRGVAVARSDAEGTADLGEVGPAVGLLVRADGYAWSVADGIPGEVVLEPASRVAVEVLNTPPAVLADSDLVVRLRPTLPRGRRGDWLAQRGPARTAPLVGARGAVADTVGQRGRITLLARRRDDGTLRKLVDAACPPDRDAVRFDLASMPRWSESELRLRVALPPPFEAGSCRLMLDEHGLAPQVEVAVAEGQRLVQHVFEPLSDGRFDPAVRVAQEDAALWSRLDPVDVRGATVADRSVRLGPGSIEVHLSIEDGVDPRSLVATVDGFVDGWSVMPRCVRTRRLPRDVILVDGLDDGDYRVRVRGSDGGTGSTARMVRVAGGGASRADLIVGLECSLAVRFPAPVEGVTLWLETMDGQRVGRRVTPVRVRHVFHVPRSDYRVVLQRDGSRLERLVRVGSRFVSVDFR